MNNEDVVCLEQDDLERVRTLYLRKEEARAMSDRSFSRAERQLIEFHEQLAAKYDLFGIGDWSIQLTTGEVIVDVNKRSLCRGDVEE